MVNRPWWEKHRALEGNARRELAVDSRLCGNDGGEDGPAVLWIARCGKRQARGNGAYTG